MKFLKKDIEVNFGKISLKEMLFDDKFKLLLFYRLANYYIYKPQKNPIERFLQSIFNKFFKYYSKKFCMDFKAKVKIGYGLYIPHPIGIVINGKSVIGNNCTIMQQVTLGNDLIEINKAPIVGDNVKIGANAVVTKDIPDNCVVAGVPAKIIRRLDEVIN
ncbi:serine O-acetyltransferase [Lebetimonas natsushimae]|uniref:Serine O-acetyltransferase n=1 Tax=Lebetimonas natsushimae TaxID=1936991 RepID=A0A292Y7T0_9BACT|nr:hypothetical protein [Lebetimonas natsushimae]GAX86812.1 serine O-acetyltransferase [Lebetimonas natsushimae]